MALIRVRATANLFNSGSEDIALADRGFKKPGDIFHVDERKFTPNCMEKWTAAIAKNTPAVDPAGPLKVYMRNPNAEWTLLREEGFSSATAAFDFADGIYKADHKARRKMWDKRAEVKILRPDGSSAGDGKPGSKLRTLGLNREMTGPIDSFIKNEPGLYGMNEETSKKA